MLQRDTSTAVRLVLPLLAVLWGSAGCLSASGPTGCPDEIQSNRSYREVESEARRLFRDGCFPAARSLAEVLVEVTDRDFGADSVESAAALEILTESSFWLGERGPQVIAWARRAYTIRKQSGQSTSLAASARNLGLLLASRIDDPARAEEAWILFDEARQIWTRAGDQDEEIALVMAWIVELIEDWGAIGRDRAHSTPWIAELSDPSTAGGQSVLQLVQELKFSYLDRRALEIDPALAIALRSVALSGAAKPNGRIHGECLNVLGKVFNHRQAYRESLVVFDRTLEARLAAYPSEHPQVSRAFFNRGEARMLIGDFEGARPDIEKAHAIRLSYVGERYLGMIASSQRLLGKLHYFTGNLREALILYRDAVDQLDKTYGGYFFVEGLLDLAETLEELNDLDQAEHQYSRALEVLARPSDETATATSAVERQRVTLLSKLGRLTLRRGDPDRAETLLRDALRREENLQPRPDVDFAETLQGLAEIEANRGDARAALELFQKASSALSDHPAQIDLLSRIAEIQLDLDHPAEAATTLASLGGLVEALGGSAYEAQARLQSLSARLAIAQNRRGDALDRAIAATNLYARHLAPVFRVLAPDTALRLALAHRQSLDLTLSLLADSEVDERHVLEAWQSVARLRGQVLEELTERYHWTHRESDPAILRLLAELRDARRNLAEVQLRPRRAESMSERQVLLEYSDKRLRAIERRFAELTGRFRAEGTSELQLEDYLSDLSPQSSLLGFVRFSTSLSGRADERYGVFVWRSGRASFLDLESADRLDDLISRWRQLVLLGDRVEPSRLELAGRDLRAVLWDPIQSHLDDSKEIAIVPEGALAFLPFAALPGSLPGTFLIEDGYQTSYFVAERDLQSRDEQRPAVASLLAVGGPDFNAETTGRSTSPPSGTGSNSPTLRRASPSERPLYFEPLPEARAEALSVARIFEKAQIELGHTPHVKVLLDAEATESAFTALAPTVTGIHVASHAFVSAECSTRLEYSDSQSPASEPAPCLMGLAFAGANRTALGPPTTDGILTADEIAGLDLSRVRWVTLAGCDTALGPSTRGEGVQGLARAFRASGAGSLIQSLWPVEDRVAHDWITNFYHSLLNDEQPVPNAARLASLAPLFSSRTSGSTTSPAY